MKTLWRTFGFLDAEFDSFEYFDPCQQQQRSSLAVDVSESDHFT